jgi:hypothetical protein
MKVTLAINTFDFLILSKRLEKKYFLRENLTMIIMLAFH